MLKEPNTMKMRRLLEQLIESDARSTKLMKELQEDASKVLGIAPPKAIRRKAVKK
jgi:hypothetical protein